MEPIPELERLLRPAGGGLHLVSSGLDAQRALQRRLYAAASDEEVEARFRAALRRLAGARALILGLPSDVGAGVRRGASLGPQAIRARLLEEEPGYGERLARAGVVDVGDVRVVPQLLDDEMLSAAQIEATRRALYPDLAPGEAAALPVSPLSIAERALGLLLSLAPRAVPVLLGGDHSVAWPAVSALASRHPQLAILHVDAHTDLLPERLGVRHCFGTWAFHANERIGRGGRLIQVGIRASRHDRGHWEREEGVRQIWAAQVRSDPAAAAEAVFAALRASGASALYLSNDIDGTDAPDAEATGTPEPGGLSPDFVAGLVERLPVELPGMPLVGADLVEVAPELARTPEGSARTLATAARYLRATLAAALGAPP